MCYTSLMLSSIINTINWVDVGVLILLLRIGYIALKNGLAHEVFKLFATVTAAYISLHYYGILAAAVRGRLNLKGGGPEHLELFIFLALSVLAFIIFFFLRKILSKALKVEIIPVLDKWGSFIFGLARGLLAASLLLFLLRLSDAPVLSKELRESYSVKYIGGIAPAVYNSLRQGIFSKFL